MVSRPSFPTYDMALIAGSSYAASIYQAGSIGSPYAVVGPGANPGLGGNYCGSGAFGAESCLLSVASLNSMLCDTSSVCTPNLTRLLNNGVQPGDSGGPFYGRSAITVGALPRGSIVGGNTADVFMNSWNRLKSAYPNLAIVW